MAQEGQVYIGKYEATFIFKIEGRLTQKSLHNVNAAVERCTQDQEITELLVDIARCSYMDSTILGLIARWAIAFGQTHRSLPFLLGLPGHPLENTIERMSLNTLFHVSRNIQLAANSALSQIAVSERVSKQEYAEYLLSAHQTLAELSPENAKDFSLVIECLRAELQNSKEE